MNLDRCQKCHWFTTIYVTGDGRKYPACAMNSKKCTWDVKQNECKFEKKRN